MTTKITTTIRIRPTTSRQHRATGSHSLKWTRRSRSRTGATMIVNKREEQMASRRKWIKRSCSYYQRYHSWARDLTLIGRAQDQSRRERSIWSPYWRDTWTKSKQRSPWDSGLRARLIRWIRREILRLVKCKASMDSMTDKVTQESTIFNLEMKWPCKSTRGKLMIRIDRIQNTEPPSNTLNSIPAMHQP